MECTPRGEEFIAHDTKVLLTMKNLTFNDDDFQWKMLYPSMHIINSLPWPLWFLLHVLYKFVVPLCTWSMREGNLFQQAFSLGSYICVRVEFSLPRSPKPDVYQIPQFSLIRSPINFNLECASLVVYRVANPLSEMIMKFNYRNSNCEKFKNLFFIPTQYKIFLLCFLYCQMYNKV